jgi:hypothetical protein
LRKSPITIVFQHRVFSVLDSILSLHPDQKAMHVGITRGFMKTPGFCPSLVKSFPAIPNMPWFADILLNLCVCGARTTHNQQTQPSQPAIALTKNTTKNSLHDGLSSDPPGIVVEIVGTARVRNIQLTVASCWRKMWWCHIFSITILIPTLP